jgi:hypothetical protein
VDRFAPSLGIAVLWCCGACGGEPARAAQNVEPTPSPAAEQRPAAAATVLAATQPASVPVGAAPALRFAGTELLQDELLQKLGSAVPQAFKPVGSTSTVFRTRLGGGFEAAWKARTRNRPHGPASEVAAYRLARCLHLDSTPPAISRRVRVSQLRDLLDPKRAASWPQIEERLLPESDGTVRVAAIYWIPVLADVGVDRQSGRKLVGQWLGGEGAIPDGKRSLAASLSTMVAFDFLIANFDRWSGDNVAGDERGEFVYLRDHDQAFQLGLGEAVQRQMLADVARCERFSRRFYQSLRAFDRGCFERELSQDPEGLTLLGERQMTELLDRREALLSHIETLIAEQGEARVLVFE